MQVERKQLLEKIHRNKTIIEGLENHEPFNMFLRDVKNYADSLDKSWQWITDMDKLKEAQITKMATITVTDCILNYKNDLKLAVDNLNKLDESAEDTEDKTKADSDNE